MKGRSAERGGGWGGAAQRRRDLVPSLECHSGVGGYARDGLDRTNRLRGKRALNAVRNLLARPPVLMEKEGYQTDERLAAARPKEGGVSRAAWMRGQSVSEMATGTQELHHAEVAGDGGHAKLCKKQKKEKKEEAACRKSITAR